MRLPYKRRLDLARLDAEAAQLHLMIDAAEEVEPSVAAEPRQVAAPVEATAFTRAGLRVGNEALGGEVGAPEVAARQARAADQDLARGAERYRPPAAVVEATRGCRRAAARWRRCRCPPRRAPARRAEPLAGGGDGDLGRSVGVDQGGRGQLAEGAAGVRADSASPPVTS